MCGAQCEHMKGGQGWPCGDGQCIKMDNKCDGLTRYERKEEAHCKNLKDNTVEACGANCEDVPGGGWACNNGQCIQSAHWLGWGRCDGVPSYGNCDCRDGSDEDDCPGRDEGGRQCPRSKSQLVVK